MLNIILGLATFTAAEWAAVGTLILGLSLHGIVTPFLEQEQHATEDELHVLERAYQRSRAKPIVNSSPVRQKLDRFYSVLVPEDQLGQSIGKLFDLGRRSGVTLEKADYRLTTQEVGHYRTYQIDLPMKADYPAILAFCEQVLAELPFASLDAVKFHRDQVSSGQIEATIRVTFFVSARSARSSPPLPAPPAETHLIAETVR